MVYGMETKKIRPGLYRMGEIRIENSPSEHYEKSKPWIVVDERTIPESPICRAKTLKEALKDAEYALKEDEY